MLNEGLIVNDTTALVKSEIVNQIRQLGTTAPDALEQAVFQSLTGHTRDDVDWDVDDNQAGYYSWLKSFDALVHELIEDGYIRTEEPGHVAPNETDPASVYSYLVYPPAPSS